MTTTSGDNTAAVVRHVAVSMLGSMLSIVQTAILQWILYADAIGVPDMTVDNARDLVTVLDDWMAINTKV